MKPGERRRSAIAFWSRTQGDNQPPIRKLHALPIRRSIPGQSIAHVPCAAAGRAHILWGRPVIALVFRGHHPDIPVMALGAPGATCDFQCDSPIRLTLLKILQKVSPKKRKVSPLALSYRGVGSHTARPCVAVKPFQRARESTMVVSCPHCR